MNIANIWDPYKLYHFLKECNENFQMHKKLQKMYFFGQFKDYNSGRKHGN